MFCAVVAEPLFKIAIPEAMQPSYSAKLASGKHLSLFHHFAPKPVDDSFVTTDEAGCTLCEGILLSHSQAELKAITEQDKHSSLATVHGQFACLHFSTQTEELRLYTNIANNFRVYYYYEHSVLIAASSIKLITGILKANSISISPDETGVRMMLSYGYMLRNYTTVNGIRQLGSANVLRLSSGKLSQQSYFRFDTSIKHTRYSQGIADLKSLFTNAVKQGLNRDADKQHFAFISGGLDSRLVVWTARELNIRQLDCLNFSQPGYLDESIARQICQTLGYKHHFYSLEGGEYLLSLDDNLRYHEGQIVLHGAAHLYAAIQTMPLSQYGIMHSGQIGDVIKGSYLQARGHTPVNLFAGAYSTRIMTSLLPEIKKYSTDYATHEQFILENRGFNCITNGDLACLDFGYSVSPFVEPAFMQYCLSIDPALRAGARMYIYWMQKSYPQASRFKWEKFNCPVSTPYYLARLQYNLWRGTDKLKRKLTHKPNTLNMNPFDYWWSTNPALKQHFIPLFRNPASVSALISKELVNEINLMFNEGNLSEKFQAYTAVKSIEYLLI